MAVDPADILMKHSRGVTNEAGNSTVGTANGSLGGQMASSQITSASLNNLFDEVSSADNAAGATEDEYRCFFFHNTDALALTNVRIFLQSESTPNTTISIGLDPVGAIAGNSPSGTPMAAVIANEDAVPSGVTFSAPTTDGTGLIPGGSPAGELGPGEAIAVWVKRVPSGGAAANENVTIRIAGDTLP